MRSIAVGPRARGVIDLHRPVAENVQQVAESFGRQPLDITALVLDRPRHHDLIEELRSSGTRIKLIGDGTVTASISAAIRGTNDHLAIGIGGTRQAVLTAAALRCLGGGMQAQLWPTTRSQIDAAHEIGIDDIGHVFTEEDLAPGDVIVVATGMTNGDLLRGVRFLADSARTHSLVMCMRCNWVRFDDGIHFFARERKEEVRLLGVGYFARELGAVLQPPRRLGDEALVDEERRRVHEALTARGLRPMRFRFDFDGARIMANFHRS